MQVSCPVLRGEGRGDVCPLTRPSRATWPYQNGTQTPKPVAQVLVCPFVSGAACEPRQSRQAHSGGRWDEIVNPVPTTPTGGPTSTHQQGHPAEAHVDSETREP